jgi:hypothetical protein
MLLSDLVNFVSHVWTPPAKLPGRLTMIIPSLADVRNCAQADRVTVQCREAAQLLAAHLYVWRKPPPGKATVKQWNKETMSFTGMNITDFQNFLMANFNLVTADNHPWLLDRSIAAMIWEACCAADSPLGLASWQEEINRKRLEARK